jgi:hypothetical protein
MKANSLTVTCANWRSRKPNMARQAVDDIFLHGLGQIIQQGRNAIAGENSPEFGPTLIAAMASAKTERIGKKELVAAMTRLRWKNPYRQDQRPAIKGKELHSAGLAKREFCW